MSDSRKLPGFTRFQLELRNGRLEANGETDEHIESSFSTIGLNLFAAFVNQPHRAPSSSTRIHRWRHFHHLMATTDSPEAVTVDFEGAELRIWASEAVFDRLAASGTILPERETSSRGQMVTFGFGLGETRTIVFGGVELTLRNTETREARCQRLEQELRAAELLAAIG